MENEEELAPDGKIWVCGACGKSNKDKFKVGDVSCYVNSVLCKDEKEEVEGEMMWIYSPEEQ